MRLVESSAFEVSNRTVPELEKLESNSSVPRVIVEKLFVTFLSVKNGVEGGR